MDFLPLKDSWSITTLPRSIGANPIVWSTSSLDSEYDNVGEEQGQDHEDQNHDHGKCHDDNEGQTYYARFTYPIQIYISEHVHAPTLCPKGTQTAPN